MSLAAVTIKNTASNKYIVQDPPGGPWTLERSLE
jgi:hypothetical protein